MVQKELSCPHCKKTLSFGSGFEHDADLNFICSHCSKIIFAVTIKDEVEVKKLIGSLTSHISSYSRKEALPIRLSDVEDIEVPEIPVQPKQIIDIDEKDIEELQCFC